ncbi:CDP-diacylglycerol diphosphatase [Mycobacterium sp.]|uniref:CDP-diacylglycerol diphosphatase n=1 Tax=Mycobacterium sp. TaxID=1785 RepID=UPI002BE670DA|nr:CDP-diacylglycerol diphosphatase [Mycobacterium sp.]HME48684.1 CDP-diacylglycerol diphosphatase [Mycobacterium sp.]
MRAHHGRSPTAVSRAWTLGRFLFVYAAALIVACRGLSVGRAHADPDAIWTIVHDRCVPDQQHSGDPAPCALVDVSGGEDNGYAVLKDIDGATQFLLIPTGRMSGIGSPAVLAPGATNFFAAAWRARFFVDQRAGRPVPRDWVSLAINSQVAQTQDQLHIHIDCIRADVHQALTDHAAEIGTTWAAFPIPLAGHPYSAIAVNGDDLDAVNPFTLLADRDKRARADMADESLVVVGTFDADGQPGFVILADRVDTSAGDTAAGEELQDHASCPPATAASTLTPG